MYTDEKRLHTNVYQKRGVNREKRLNKNLAPYFSKHTKKEARSSRERRRPEFIYRGDNRLNVTPVQTFILKVVKCKKKGETSDKLNKKGHVRN